MHLPSPIAIYVAAENRGDPEALAHCFAEDAVVRDEGQTIEGLTAIKQWKVDQKEIPAHNRAACVQSKGRQGDCDQPTHRKFPWQSDRARVRLHARGQQDCGTGNPLVNDRIRLPERVRFAELPTPIEKLDRLTRHLGGPEIYVKRDDQTGLATGATRRESWSSC